MEFKREASINKLIGYRHNHLIKVVTGLRRVGKSYLLFTLYKRYLIEQGINKDHIIEIQLDDYADRNYRKAEVLYDFVEKKAKSDSGMFYVMIDEVQMLEEFVDVLNGFLHIQNLDVYVTGSNAKFLSSDIITEFRGRGVQIHLAPLSFKEIVTEMKVERDKAWRDYLYYGGIPMVVMENNEQLKVSMLNQLIQETYLTDIINRNRVNNDADLEELFKLLASNIGGLTNPTKLSNTFKSEKKIDINSWTIKKYIDYFIDSFLLSRAIRYDIKGKKYIDTPCKYYFSDMGLRNALLDFRQVEPTHVMENILYNYLLDQGYGVDVGVLQQYSKDIAGKTRRSILEIDFVCNRGSERVYIQSAYSLPDEDKLKQEQRSLTLIGDSFPKWILTTDNIPKHQLENGITLMNVYDFLLL